MKGARHAPDWEHWQALALSDAIFLILGIERSDPDPRRPCVFAREDAYLTWDREATAAQRLDYGRYAHGRAEQGIRARGEP